jgi:PAS domain S-box-containing protein
LALAALYFGAAKVGLSMGVVEQVSVVWPPTGLALAAILLFGYRVWPGIALGAFLANWTASEPIAVAAGIATGNTLEALTGAWLLQQVGFDSSLQRLKDVLSLLILAVAISTTVSASIGVTTLCLGGVQEWSSFASLWSVWWLGDATGGLVVAPVLLAWAKRPGQWPLTRLAEAGALLAGLVATGLLVFGGPLPGGIRAYQFAYTVFLFAIWAAFRFGQQGTSGLTLVASSLAIWGTWRGYGPFATGSMHENLLALQVFMGVVAVTSLLLSAALAERKWAASALAEGEDRSRSVLDHMVDGVITIDESGRVESVNPAAERLFGYGAAEIVGNNVKLLMPEPYHGEHDDYLASYVRTGKAKIIGIGREVVGRRKDGSTFPLELAVSTFRVGPRRLFTGIVRDISRRKRAEEAVRASEEQLRLADRRKDEFLALLAHELRNPLAAIRNGVAVMRMVHLTDPLLLELREMLERQVDHLRRMVDDLLDVSRIARGKVKLQKQPVELARVIGAAVETCRPLIDARRQELAIALPSEPLWMFADPTRLAQIFANLVNNAAKYTEQGGRIWLSAKAIGRGPQSPCEVEVFVRDTGIGISAEMLPHVFDMFSQADRSRGHSDGGLGIGLMVVRNLVEMHAGTVHASSEGPGKGSEFVVRIPLLARHDDREETKSPVDENGLAGAAPGCNILVVDDNRDALYSLVKLLQLQGHTVCEAQNGPDALEAAQERRPDVVLLDIGLPGMDGLEVARRIRNDLGFKDTLLVAMSGYGQEDDRCRSLEAGCNAHLVKPVDLRVLTTMLAERVAGAPQ